MFDLSAVALPEKTKSQDAGSLQITGLWRGHCVGYGSNDRLFAPAPALARFCIRAGARARARARPGGHDGMTAAANGQPRWVCSGQRGVMRLNSDAMLSSVM